MSPQTADIIRQIQRAMVASGIDTSGEKRPLRNEPERPDEGEANISQEKRPEAIGVRSGTVRLIDGLVKRAVRPAY